MTFHQLKIFCQVVESGSVTRASQVLGIPQPAATRAIRSLENEWGLALFDRAGRGLVLNDHGRLLYDYAKKVLTMTEGLQETMTSRKAEEDSSISIIVEAASHLFPHICTAFSARHPQAVFRALHRESPGQGGTGYPLRLFSSRERPTDPDTVVLADEEIKLAVPREGPLGDREVIRLAEVSQMGFVSLFKTRGLRQITDYYCQEAGFQPRIIFETDNTTTVTRYVSSGHGVAFIPQLTWPAEEEDLRVHLVSVTQPACRRFINLSLDQGANLSPYEGLFHDFLIDYFKKLPA